MSATCSGYDVKCSHSEEPIWPRGTEFIIDPMSIVGAIVEYAERENIDVLVIGSRGLTGFKKLLVGSVASGVVTYASCPVMVVK